jgi:hypothetical protein
MLLPICKISYIKNPFACKHGFFIGRFTVFDFSKNKQIINYVKTSVNVF